MPLSKSAIIKATLAATKERRQHQTCRVYRVKISRAHVNHETRCHLRRLFLEAKWLYNHLLAQPDIFTLDYKHTEVRVKVKDTYETRRLHHLSSQMKQALLERIHDNIRGLAQLKAKGHRVGPSGSNPGLAPSPSNSTATLTEERARTPASLRRGMHGAGLK